MLVVVLCLCVCLTLSLGTFKWIQIHHVAFCCDTCVIIGETQVCFLPLHLCIAAFMNRSTVGGKGQWVEALAVNQGFLWQLWTIFCALFALNWLPNFPAYRSIQGWVFNMFVINAIYLVRQTSSSRVQYHGNCTVLMDIAFVYYVSLMFL